MSHFFKKVKEKYFTRNGDTLYFGALRRIIFIFILFVFLLGISVISWIKFIQKSDGTIKVPLIKGKDILEASEMIQKRKLTLKIIPVVNNKVPKYRIIQQNPAANTTVREGRIVEVVISSGQMFARMPNFIDKPLNQVKQLILGQKPTTAMGKLILRNITYVPSEKGVNTVIAQTPNPDTGLNGVVPVTLVVSNGIHYGRVRLSNYRNEYFEKAVKELSSRNMRVIIKSQNSNNQMLGRILNQNPPAGTNIYPGTEVTLFVGSGGKSKIPRKAVLIKYKLPVSGNKPKVPIKIIVSDAGDDRIVFQGTASPGEKVIEAFMIRGLAKAKIFVNNTLIKEYAIE